ncbi:lysozyme [Pseudescherichia vulneris]|uniref:lysozyme n=1 Tax=Pseudescherichia vulneris TaxID=566 RepID=UPI0028D4B402|nr:lysozyme [Pseudescherichia vulneris]
MSKLPDRTGERGLQLITTFEGLKLKRYRDSVEKWTIGYGHLILPAEEKKLITITTGEAKALLIKDLRRTEAGVHKYLKKEVTQNQFDALISLAFNIGVGNLQKSTLLRRINQGDIKGAAQQFLVWNKAGKQVLPGLTRRREAERKLFLSDKG